VVSAMERHFRERGWRARTSRCSYNHKSDTKVRVGWRRDRDLWATCHTLPSMRGCEEGTATRYAGQIRCRADASWMRSGSQGAGAHRQLLVLGGTEFSWFPYGRGCSRIGATLSGSTAVLRCCQVSSAITLFPVRHDVGNRWLHHWLTVSAGDIRGFASREETRRRLSGRALRAFQADPKHPAQTPAQLRAGLALLQSLAASAPPPNQGEVGNATTARRRPTGGIPGRRWPTHRPKMDQRRHRRSAPHEGFPLHEPGSAAGKTSGSSSSSWQRRRDENALSVG